MRSIDEIREQFSHDRFASENGAFIEEVGDGYAKCSVKLADRHKNAMGGVMGGVHFMLADFAFAAAANHEKMSVVSISSNIAFLSPVKGDILYAEARCVKDGRTTCYYNVNVYDDTGKQAAAVTIMGCHLA